MKTKVNTTLVVLAAGMGSRFGGIKQIEPVGPHGEIILDYSIYDAIRFGFTKIVFVIRKSIEDSFRQKINPKAAEQIKIEYVYQEIDSALGGFPVPAGREKPWGTGHAVLVARSKVTEPFAVINADDFYGPSAYEMMNRHLAGLAQGRVSDYAMVGYPLGNTLSDYGTVSRGVCETDKSGMLKHITERTKLEKHPGGTEFTDENGVRHFLPNDTVVSMNYWGFGPDVFGYLEKEFRDFLSQKGTDLKAEYYLPFAIGGLIIKGIKQCQVMTAKESWFGITYREDLQTAQNVIREKIHQGVYPKELWSTAQNPIHEKIHLNANPEDLW